MIKLSMSRAWEDTKAILARDGRLFVSVALALFVLPGVVLDLSMPASGPGEFPKPGTWMAVGLVAVLVSLVGQLAVIRLSMGPHLTVGEAISHGVRRLIAYVGAVILWTLPFILIGAFLVTQVSGNPQDPRPGASLALLVLMGVGIFFAVRFILGSAVASAEQLGPIAILGRSWSLTQGSWWRLFVFLLMFAIGAVVLLWAVESVLGVLAKVILGDTSPMTVGALVIAIIGQFVSGLVSVTFFVMLARLYHQAAGSDQVQASVPTTGI